MGNVAADETQTTSAPDLHAAVPKLVPFSKPFDASAYLSADSDVVAHLVLAHQTQMHNLITLTNYKTRLAVFSHAQATRGSPQVPSDTSLPDNVRQQFEGPAEQVVHYLLFAKEATLTGSSLKENASTSAFAKEFSARGPKDARGRALRQFDLSTRIFRYPCSYLIYSDAFDALPEPAKEYVYHRLLQVLSGEDKSPDFAHLSTEDRRNILEILLATKRGLPEEWSRYAHSNHLAAATGAALTMPPHS